MTVDGHIAIITINRPEARNAVNGNVASAMEVALDHLDGDDDLWVGIITGEGTAFCAGADLKEIAAGNAGGLATKRGGFGGIVAHPRETPLIAAVNGPAVAGGCEILLSCDMAVVADHVVIGIPEVKRALVAAAGGLFRLPRAIGPALAMELALTGDPIPAQQALDLGLINRVVAADQVMTEARALAERVAVNAPLAVKASKAIVRGAFEKTEQELFRESGQAMAAMAQTEDFAEGPRAFIEKRAPEWKGR
ncbi:MAG: enoyl-CoA hydratase [Acidimicrobiales bacterium]|nr:enoyl-CoA hydratase [Acidimicrobiales bacterium]